MLIDFTLLYRIDLAWNCLLCTFYPGFFICLGFFSVTCLYFARLPARESGYTSIQTSETMEIEKHLHLISPKATASAIYL